MSTQASAASEQSRQASAADGTARHTQEGDLGGRGDVRCSSLNIRQRHCTSVGAKGRERELQKLTWGSADWLVGGGFYYIIALLTVTKLSERTGACLALPRPASPAGKRCSGLPVSTFVHRKIRARGREERPERPLASTDRSELERAEPLAVSSHCFAYGLGSASQCLKLHEFKNGRHPSSQSTRIRSLTSLN